jgi:hypothetical protein
MDKGNNNLLAAIMIEMEVAKILPLIEQDTSERSWADVNKSKLPRQSFLWVEDPKKKDTWHLPYREGTGGIDPETGMYRQAGAVNLNALRAISQAVAGAHTGTPMRIPSEIRSKINKLLKKYKIGKFAERQEGKKVENYCDLRESIFANSQIRHDSENCIVHGMAILGNTSTNCSVKTGKGRNYSETAQLSVSKLIEGERAFVDHATQKELKERGGIRKVRDLLGYYRNGRVEGKTVRADLHYNPCHKEWFGWYVDNMPAKIGGSIHAYGPSSYNDNTLLETVQDVKILRSVDIVTEPGSTNNLFESLGRTNSEMDINSITFTDLKEKRPDLLNSIQKEYEESEKVKALNREREANLQKLQESNKQLKEELDKYKVKEVLAAKKEVITKKIEAAKMPKELVTDVFIESLMGVEDDKKIDELITDRKSLMPGKTVIGMGDENKTESFNYDTAKVDYGKAIPGYKESTK